MSTKASPLRKALAWMAVILVAAVVGGASTKPLLRYLIDQYATHNGPWRSSVTTGSAAANPWERAAVAVAGLYALTPQEAIYYTAFTDSSGETLRGECRYRVSGKPPPARWWSLTAYGADHYLVPNPAGLHARHAGNLPPSADGYFNIMLAPRATGQGSLPTPAKGPYSVTLRVYNPGPEVRSQLATLPLPTIVREGCP